VKRGFFDEEDFKRAIQFYEDINSGKACLCDTSIVKNPFLLRVATLSHGRVYFVRGAFEETCGLEDRLPPSAEAAFEAGTLFAMSTIDWLMLLEVTFFEQTLAENKIEFDDYKTAQDEHVLYPRIDAQAVKRLSKLKAAHIYELTKKADPTFKMRSLLKHHKIWRKLRFGATMFERSYDPIGRALELDFLIPLEQIGIIKRVDKKTDKLTEREKLIYDESQFISLVSSVKAPSMTCVKRLTALAKLAGVTCNYISDIRLPDLRQTVMEMDFKQLSNASGRLALLPKLIKNLNDATKEFLSINVLAETVNKLISENQEELLEEFGRGKEILKFHSFDMRNITYPFSETYYRALIPSYIIEAIGKLSKEERRTRKILRKELREIKEKLETIQFDITEIGFKVSMTKIARDEIEIAFPLGLPFGPHVTYKYRLYPGNVDLSQVTEAKRIISKEVEKIIEEIKGLSYETYKKLLSAKESFVKGVFQALKKLQRKSK